MGGTPVLHKSKASHAGRLSRTRVSLRQLFLGGFGFRGFSFGGVALGILAAEALHPAGRVHELLLAGKEGMTGGADFYADVALVRGAGDKRVAASAMYANLVVVRMDCCFHEFLSPRFNA